MSRRRRVANTEPPVAKEEMVENGDHITVRRVEAPVEDAPLKEVTTSLTPDHNALRIAASLDSLKHNDRITTTGMRMAKKLDITVTEAITAIADSAIGRPWDDVIQPPFLRNASAQARERVCAFALWYQRNPDLYPIILRRSRVARTGRG